MVGGVGLLLCWYETGESALIGPKIVQQTIEKVKMIQSKMRVAQSRQKSYQSGAAEEL